jgi:integrase/recombinase XerD
MPVWLSAFPKTSERLACSPIKQYLINYLAHLTEQRYPPKTMRKHADYLLCFGEFLGRLDRLNAAQFCESVEPFLAELASRLSSAPKVRHILNRFLGHLRQTGSVPALEPTVPDYPHAILVDAYCDSLRTLRALKDRTIRQLRGTCRRFMTFLGVKDEASLRSLQPEVIHRFLISRGQQCCRSSLRTQCSTMRGYLAYLHRRGAIALDLSGVVVAPRVYQHDQCPRFLTRPQIDTLLAIIDRKTQIGRRDYAMLLLLIVYGLRGLEAARLRLDDIDWRNKKLHIRGRKAGNTTTYPLSASVKDAIIDYLRNGRPTSSHREVFLSVIAPFRPLLNGAALASHIVKYLKQVGIEMERPGRTSSGIRVRNGYSRRGCRSRSLAITWGTPIFTRPSGTRRSPSTSYEKSPWAMARMCCERRHFLR